jgi:hypothetical protein
MVGIDPATATVDDLVRLPPIVKQEAQDEWDAIVTTPDIDRAGAEQVLASQGWFSYTPAGYQVFSSGGLEWRAWRLRLGLGAVRYARLPCVAVASARRARLRLERPPGEAGRTGGR